MEQPTPAPLPLPSDAEREFWRRAVEAERRRSREPAGGEDELGA